MSLPAQPNRSLIDGIACLQAVVSADGAVGSREIARRLGLEHTRTNRLLGTLCHLGILQKGEGRKYSPGPGVHLLSAQSLHGSGLLPIALKHLHQLAEENLILSLGVLWEQQVCYLIRAMPGQQPEAAIGAHTPFPAHRSILGLPLLVNMSDTEIQSLFSTGEGKLTKKQLASLLGEIRQTKKQQYAVRFENKSYAVAVPVGNPAIAALGLTGIAHKSTVTRLAKKLTDIAARITDEMD